MQNTGLVLPGFPALGSCVSYGLGSLTEKLPPFVMLPDLWGLAPNGTSNWSAGLQPATYQGTRIHAGRPNPISDLFPPGSAK